MSDMRATAFQHRSTTVELAVSDELERNGDFLGAIEVLVTANRRAPEAALEARLARVRKAAFDALPREPGHASWPPPSELLDDLGTTGVPVFPREELSADALRAQVFAHGSVHVPALVSSQRVDELVAGIDRALDTWAGLRRPFSKPTGSPWFDPLPVDADEQARLGRTWVTNGAGLLTCDSPRMLGLLLDTFEEAGLHEVVRGYLGERPVLSANKCTLRRVPVDTNASWHQDGAFLGRGIRAINIWLSLSHCGVDAPGLDIVPRRFDHVVETGTHGSYFDWAVGPELVEDVARETPVARPVFAPGDALVFDDMLLHKTATEPSMTNVRYAIETWMFAPSSYPEGHVPLVW